MTEYIGTMANLCVNHFHSARAEPGYRPKNICDKCPSLLAPVTQIRTSWPAPFDQSGLIPFRHPAFFGSSTNVFILRWLLARSGTHASALPLP